MKRLILLLILNTIFVGEILSQTTLRVLAIGNSFSEDAVEQHLYELGREAGYNLILGNAYRGGQGLESHWKVVSQGEAAFEYRKVVDGKRTNRKEVVLDSIVLDEPWDIISLQQVSQDAGLFASYDPYLTQLIDYVIQRARNSNMQLVFHQTWAYAQTTSHKGFANYESDQQRMYSSIVEAVHHTYDTHPQISAIIPSGTAIQNLRQTPLGDHLCRDAYHLDLLAGRYTAACTWFELLTGHTCVGLQYRPKGLRAEVAALCQQAAHDAVALPEAVPPRPETAEWVDTCRISVFGSSVAHGTGATDDHGYAYLYNQLMRQRYTSGSSKYPFKLSDISIGGNTSRDLLNRYHDLIFDLGRYVIFGISLGNEGIHNNSRPEAIFERWRDNMLRLISMARADGKIPVVMNNYGRADFTARDYNYVRRLNLLIHEWDVPSVNLLGAIEDGKGHWAQGFEADPYHPNSQGHREMMYAIPPSLFDALAQGKPLPVRDSSHDLLLSRGQSLVFSPEPTVHSFALSVTLRGSDRGRVITLKTNGKEARIGINRDHKAYYRSPSGDSIVSQVPLDNKARHTITLTHRYAQRRTLFYVDTERQIVNERMLLRNVTIGDHKSRTTRRHFGELFFWRSALTQDEVMALMRGSILRSSLEIYCPLDEANRTHPTNLAQTLNKVRYASH